MFELIFRTEASSPRWSVKFYTNGGGAHTRRDTLDPATAVPLNGRHLTIALPKVNDGGRHESR